jgi:hypothetical protein
MRSITVALDGLIGVPRTMMQVLAPEETIQQRQTIRNAGECDQSRPDIAAQRCRYAFDAGSSVAVSTASGWWLPGGKLETLSDEGLSTSR